ncbi:hypothetical protein E2562_038477 [Oryza meyeriana var. granulata]|uniref:Uncharacterized protein n=1 Tax=Oryza meyeriana var. granulata TaxID=110450 RepID=A0A6G1C2F2_9ORYZ|nr:hypothetical protein E2562_038477 [Oryza meyeriana var. granulata]
MPMIFVGYEPGAKAYRCYDPASRRVVVSCDVVFDEAAQWDWSAEDGGCQVDDEPFTVEYTTEYVSGAPQVAAWMPALVAPSSAPAGSPMPATPLAAPTLATSLPDEPINFVTPPADLGEDLDVDHDDDALLRFRAIDAIIGPASPPGLAPRVLDEDLMFTTADEPTSFGEAEREASIGLKWVFKVKRDEHGNVIRHKAHLVANGYVQRAGINFDEVFAPVARMESVRMLLALAAHERWTVHHMDIKSAFLNGDLKEEVYVSHPPGFIVDGSEQKVLRLRKALYGLRQAPRAWNAKLDALLVLLRFQRSSLEHGIYMQNKGAS